VLKPKTPGKEEIMNKAVLQPMWEHFRTINGITLRAIQAIPQDKLDARPCTDMRTPKELVAHMYNSLRVITDGTAKGEIHWSEEDDKKAAAGLHSKDELYRFALDSWTQADKAVRSLTDEKLTGLVKTPWGESFPGFICVNITYDEHLHHRGQLYAFLRQLGVEPPFMWDFEHNAPEFQPRAAAAKV
jgi:uncharacterized damage-inducible protein DinB